MISKKHKSILIVGQHFWPEQFRVNDIADYLVEEGCSVDVLCGLPNYPKGDLYKGYGIFKNRRQLHKGVHIYRSLEIPRFGNTNVMILLNYLSFPFFSLFLIPRLLTKKYDKILIYQLSPVMMSIAGIIIGKIKKTETTMYVLDLWPENLFSVLKVNNKILVKIATVISHWHYKQVDKLAVLSKAMKSKLVDITGIDDKKILVLPQTCEKIYEEKIIDEALLDKYRDSFNIVYTGNISPAQSFETMIAAAQILKEKGLTDIKWIIVGDGMSKDRIRKEVDMKNLADNISFEGHKPIEEIPKYTNIADVLVGCLTKSPLLEATIPAKVVSYIAAGKPIVLAMDGEVQTLINKTIQCGYAGPTEDAEIFAQNIERVYKLNTKDRDNMGKNAKKYYTKNLEREILLSKLYAFISN